MTATEVLQKQSPGKEGCTNAVAAISNHGMLGHRFFHPNTSPSKLNEMPKYGNVAQALSMPHTNN
jgi:hypothetical protein